MVPYGLGQEVKFIKDEGPILSPFNLEIFKKIVLINSKINLIQFMKL